MSRISQIRTRVEVDRMDLRLRKQFHATNFILLVKKKCLAITTIITTNLDAKSEWLAVLPVDGDPVDLVEVGPLLLDQRHPQE